MKIVITGGTGFLGRALFRALAEDWRAGAGTRVGPGGPASGQHEVVCSSRDPERALGLLAPEKELLEASGARLSASPWHSLDAALAGADEVYHLAGEPAVGRRYTEKLKARILASRVTTTMQLVEAIGRAPTRPRVFVSASGVGYYGARPADVELGESEPSGADFLALVCVAWEAAARAVEALGTRSVQARLGIILGRGGGALPVMARPIRLFLGGRLGDGQQAVSWISLHDAARALIHCARQSSLSGPVNFAAPEATTNAELTRAIGRALGRPTPFVVPAPLLRLIFAEGAEPLLTGQRAAPHKLLASGFEFSHPSLEPALAASF